MIIYESPKNKQLDSIMFLGRVLDEKELEEIGLEIQKELNIKTNNAVAVKEIKVLEVSLAKTSKMQKINVKKAFIKLVVDSVKEQFGSIIDDLKICSIGFYVEKLAYIVGFNFQD